MINRIKNILINYRIKRRYKKKDNKEIAKQKKIFEYCELSFDKKAKVSIKEGLIVKKNVSIRCRENATLQIGKNVYFNNNCVLTCRNHVFIGDDVSFGPNVVIFDHDHDYRARDRKHTFITGEVIIGNGAWIGASAIILKGARIGKNSVIAAGAVVNCEVPDNSVFYGKGKIKQIEFKNE